MLDVAFDLFHEKGIHATGVDEVLTRSGTGKKLMIRLITSTAASNRIRFKQRLSSAPRTPRLVAAFPR